MTAANEPAVLQRKLRDRFGDRVTVSNRGVGATQISQLLHGTDGVHPPWAETMAASGAHIVTLNFALNDAWYSVATERGLIAESPADYAHYLIQVVRIAKAAGKHVVLYEPNPACDPIRSPILVGYVAELRRVAELENVQTVDHYDTILALPDWPSLLTDCVHPGEPLYAAKADANAAVLAPLVAGLVTNSTLPGTHP